MKVQGKKFKKRTFRALFHLFSSFLTLISCVACLCAFVWHFISLFSTISLYSWRRPRDEYLRCNPELSCRCKERIAEDGRQRPRATACSLEGTKDSSERDRGKRVSSRDSLSSSPSISLFPISLIFPSTPYSRTFFSLCLPYSFLMSSHFFLYHISSTEKAVHNLVSEYARNRSRTSEFHFCLCVAEEC